LGQLSPNKTLDPESEKVSNSNIEVLGHVQQKKIG